MKGWLTTSALRTCLIRYRGTAVYGDGEGDKLKGASDIFTYRYTESD